MKTFPFFMVFLTYFLFISCQKHEGYGEIKLQEESKLESFNGLQLELDCNVTVKLIEENDTLETDTLYKYTIWTKDIIYEQIEKSITNGNLVIRLKENQHISNYDPITIEVTAPDLSYIMMKSPGTITLNSKKSKNRSYLDCINMGSGTINLHRINYSFLKVNQTGSGYVYADSTGISKSALLLNAGSGRINLLNVVIDSLTANISGSGDISASIRQYLDGKISGAGNILYMVTDTTKQPVIKSNITGTGKIIHLY
jgi:hypothetical protein